MRSSILIALFAAAHLAWSGTAHGQILAEATHELAGGAYGGPATGVAVVLSVGDSEGSSANPSLFDQVVLTPADVGRVVSVGSWLDDPDFDDVVSMLTNGISNPAQLMAWLQPGGGGVGMGGDEVSVFTPALTGGIDFAGSTIDAVALRLDALALNESGDGSVYVRFTLLVIGHAGVGDDSPELAECRDDLAHAGEELELTREALEEARYEEFQCRVRNAELEQALDGLGQRLVACEVDLDSSEVERSRLEAQLVLAESALHEAEGALTVAQAERASAEAALAAALADVDADGVRDPGDGCLGSETGAAVDGVGCSLAQFCAAIDASTGSGRAICNHADWRNDEPLSDSPNDCKASAGTCDAR